MQLNVLDDLAEAMKALDGKKTRSPNQGNCDQHEGLSWTAEATGSL